MLRFYGTSVLLLLISVSSAQAQQQFEFCNNWLMNVSFITGTDRGIEQNLADNFGWMQDQGYTHLRFFGIFPNGVHCFPSPTLDANGYPNSAYHEPVLELLATKASQFGITVNFDGWEVIAESNYDTTALGVGFVTEEELGAIVQEVLSLGIDLISEEQFGSGYLQAIQSATSQVGATHETTAGLWWQSSGASLIADRQLASVFCYYPYDQAEVDSVVNLRSSLAANLGILHLFHEGPRFFDIPYSVAVGSFGTLNTENWLNVLRFVQLQHQPERFSIEETNWDFLVWDTSFNFMNEIGNELLSLRDGAIESAPIANLIYDVSYIGSPSFIPTWLASIVSASAIVNTFTVLGYKVIPTLDSVLAGADIYYVLLAGGADSVYVSGLPDYIMPLLESDFPVFIQPAFGIPDVNDGVDWTPFREFFELPSEDTYTLTNAVPRSVLYNGSEVLWSGADVHIAPKLELLAAEHFDTTESSVVLSGDVSQMSIALIIQKGNKYLINSNVIHLEAAYILSDVLAGPMNSPSSADIVVTESKAVVFAEHDTDIDIDIPWDGSTSVVRFSPEGLVTLDTEVESGGVYSESMFRGELVILTKVFAPCCNTDGIRGDADNDCTFGCVNVADLSFLVAHLFQSGPSPVCEEEADADSDCTFGCVNVADLSYLVAFLFQSGPAPGPCP